MSSRLNTDPSLILHKGIASVPDLNSRDFKIKKKKIKWKKKKNLILFRSQLEYIMF